MHKTTVVMDDEYTEYECYTDGTYWNGWANIVFTESQLRAWLSESPYDFRVMDDKSIVIYFEDEQILQPVEFVDDDGNNLTGYDMNGYCFIFKSDLDEIG